VEDVFDAVVVGAGLAGSTAAYCMAEAGLNVLVIERGPSPGAKNVTGGRLYAHSLEKVIPGFAKEAPLQRLITRETLTFLTEQSAISLDVASDKFLKFPSYTVLRPEFDAWLAGKAETAGATVVSGIRVDEPVLRDGKVVGVRCGEDTMEANVVIAADGVNSLMAQRAGLRHDLDSGEVATGVKCVIELSKKAIEERFNLDESSGVARMFVGECTKGLPGGGFLYTNLDTVSLGLVVTSGELTASPQSLVGLLEDFRQHPQLKELLAGGKVIEYSAHLVPEGGLKMVGTPLTDGLLVAGDAAGLVLNTGYSVRGMDFAVASGEAAANAVIAASKTGDFSAAGLSTYVDNLKRSFVTKDLETFQRAPSLLKNRRIYDEYPGLIEEMMIGLFAMDGSPRTPMRKVVTAAVKNHGGAVRMGKDLLQGVRSL
jgi:electron transfer flavoprotein-quinone oxidoreductase